MVETTHTDPQSELINSREGIILVNAGAGTGKTYSIINRYEMLTENGFKPDDILLITFTVKAAEEMKQKVIAKLSGKFDFSKLLEAPIMNFHSFCMRILKKYGNYSPANLGIDLYLPSNFGIMEQRTFEEETFRKFFLKFSKENLDKYKPVIHLLENEHSTVLRVIKKLCSVGIFPVKGKWTEGDKQKLTGDFEGFSDLFDLLNKPAFRTDNGKPKQNELSKKFNQITKEKIYTDFYKEKFNIGKSTINEETKEDIFMDDTREIFFEFLSEVYTAYIEHLLKRNLLNFEFVIMFAYLILYKNKSVREKSSFDHVMVDEFQDTDEIQFKLIMLLCKNIKGAANLCVVGDWKQGIYGFRNTKIENITEFAKNLEGYKSELNRDEERITYDVKPYKQITFEKNYRSSRDILNFSRYTLLVKGSEKEEFDIEEVEKSFPVSLIPARDPGVLTEIKFYKANDRLDEYRLVLKKISELVNEKDKYRIRIFNKNGEAAEDRPVNYSDICVLSRTKKFCLELKREAMNHGIPMNYSGGLEIFASEAGVLVLAWLKIFLNEKDFSGWIPVLDKEGYTYPEVIFFKENILGGMYGSRLFSDLPAELDTFRKYLLSVKNNIIFIVQAILTRYGFHDEVGNKIMTVINSWIDTDLLSVSDITDLIENSSNTEIDLDSGGISDAVLTQTIHSSKGLEYPVVILSNINDRLFPTNMADTGKLIYKDLIGVRARHFFGNNGRYFYRYNNWRSDLSLAVERKSDYDEERRLLYVAVTRAKQYLFLTSFKSSPFFKELAARTEKAIITGFDYGIKNPVKKDPAGSKIKFEPVVNASKKFTSPHILMNEENTETKISDTQEKNYSVKPGLEKLEFGNRIHNFAFKTASGIETNAEADEEKAVKKFISGLGAKELKCETDFLYPLGEKVIRGTIDLLAFYDDRIDVIDYKTDKTKNHLDKYKIQIGIYKDVIQNIYPDKKITGKIYFVSIDEVVEI